MNKITCFLRTFAFSLLLTGAASVAHAACSAGQYWNGEVCFRCPPGGYCTGTSVNLVGIIDGFTPCPSNRYRAATGGTSLASCTLCPSGWQYVSSTTGKTTITQCERLVNTSNTNKCWDNSQQAEVGCLSDYLCAPNQVVSYGSSNCPKIVDAQLGVDCGPSTYLPVNSYTCALCPKEFICPAGFRSHRSSGNDTNDMLIATKKNNGFY